MKLTHLALLHLPSHSYHVLRGHIAVSSVSRWRACNQAVQIEAPQCSMVSVKYYEEYQLANDKVLKSPEHLNFIRRNASRLGHCSPVSKGGRSITKRLVLKGSGTNVVRRTQMRGYE